MPALKRSVAWPETDASKAYMIVSTFHTSFLAAEISISAAEKTGGAVPLCALTTSLGNPVGIRAGWDRREGLLGFRFVRVVGQDGRSLRICRKDPIASRVARHWRCTLPFCVRDRKGDLRANATRRRNRDKAAQASPVAPREFYSIVQGGPRQ